MKIIFMGTPDFAAASLQALIDAGYEIPLAVTKEDKPVGRGGHLRPSDVKVCAQKAGIPVYQPHSVKTEEAYKVLAEKAPDLIVVAAFGQIIPKEILELPKFGCINVHASLLPEYRGAAPIQWAILDGKQETGVSIMKMNEGLDTGDILSVSRTPIAPDETGGSLFDRLSALGAQLLLDTIPKLEAGSLTPVRQPEKSPTPYARMIRKSDGRIDWNRSAEEIERQIRGLSPWPSAFTEWNGKTLKIWKGRVDQEKPEDASASAGEICGVEPDGIRIRCGSGTLVVESLQMAGKKRMDAAAFLRGHRIEAGMCFKSE